MTVFMGVDIGSTTIKGAVLDLDRNKIESVRTHPFPNPVPGLQPAHYEVDPQEIVAATRAVLVELLGSCDRPAGIMFSSQMGGLLIADQRRKPLTNYLSWRDQRVLKRPPASSASFDRLRARTSDDDLELIGNELRPGSAASLLFWMAEKCELPGERAVAMNLGDFVISSLCETAPKTEATLALGTLNLQTGLIHQKWFDQLDCGRVLWPEQIPVTVPAGHLFIQGVRVPCFPAVGDQQAALYGVELSDEELSVNVSTGSQVSLLSRSRRAGEYQIRPYFDGQFLHTITHLPAGRSLNALVDLLTELATAEGYTLSDPWSTISSAVQRIENDERELDVDLSFFSGTMGNRGHIQNMRLENLTVGHLFCAAFENMADNYALCAERLSPDKTWRQVVLSGSLPQKLPTLRKKIAERFECPIRSVDIPEETLAGLMRLARCIADLPSN